MTPKGKATRERIIEAATTLIAQRGVAGTGIEDVRTAAEVSGSQLYHYFDSKRSLIRAVITRQADAALASARPDLGALDSFEALRAWADAAIERQQQTEFRGDCDLGTLAGELRVTDEDSRADLATGFLRWRDLLRDGLYAMQARGELRADVDPEELALALLSALQGGVLLTETLRDIQPLHAAMNSALTYVHSYESKPPAGQPTSPS